MERWPGELSSPLMEPVYLRGYFFLGLDSSSDSLFSIVFHTCGCKIQHELRNLSNANSNLYLEGLFFFFPPNLGYLMSSQVARMVFFFLIAMDVNLSIT